MKLLANNSEFFVAEVENEKLRFGMHDGCYFDFSPYHFECEILRTLNLDDAYDLFEAYIARYLPSRPVKRAA